MQLWTCVGLLSACVALSDAAIIPAAGLPLVGPAVVAGALRALPIAGLVTLEAAVLINLLKNGLSFKTVDEILEYWYHKDDEYPEPPTQYEEAPHHPQPAYPPPSPYHQEAKTHRRRVYRPKKPQHSSYSSPHYHKKRSAGAPYMNDAFPGVDVARNAKKVNREQNGPTNNMGDDNDKITQIEASTELQNLEYQRQKEAMKMEKLVSQILTQVDTDGCLLKLLCYLQNNSDMTFEQQLLAQLFATSPTALSAYSDAYMSAQEQNSNEGKPLTCSKIFNTCEMGEKQLARILNYTWRYKGRFSKYTSG